MTNEPLDLTAIRARLANRRGQQYWRSLEEVAETDTFKEFLYREFPKGASEWAAGVSRRNFIKLMGASLALAGLSGCSTQEPVEKIVPYVQAPENLVMGLPLYYATATLLNGYARGVLVESHEGRPTKIEGNPDHPASLGASDVFMQADILTLYDPDRSQVVLNAGRISTWPAFQNELAVAMENQRADQGAGLRILTEMVTSPTLAAQIATLLEEFPQAVWHQYQPLNHDLSHAGTEIAFGEAANPVYRVDQANVILSIDTDFLGVGPAQVRYARDFGRNRQVVEAGAAMNRLYAVESTPGLSGAIADHRLRLRPSQVDAFVQALAAQVGVISDAPALEEGQPWLATVAADLQANQGRSLVVGGPFLSAATQALIHAINDSLGNTGQTVVYTDPVEANPVNQTESLQALIEAMNNDQVELLVMLGGNPVYSAPADLNFGEAFDKVPLRIHLSLYEDETSYLSHWHIPASHSLESWSDAKAYDGTTTIMQPLIAPLYDSHSAHELLSALMGEIGTSGHDIVKGYWESQQSGGDFETFWQTSLHDGLVADTALPVKSVSVQTANLNSTASEASGLEISFRPDASIWDGSYANNGWLQELPRPLTKLTWDNAILVSPATAIENNLSNEDLVELSYQGRSVTGPVWILPGQADGVVTVNFGYGRTRAGQAGSEVGFNVYALQTSASPYSGSGVELRKSGGTQKLVTTQEHHSMEGRHLVREGTLAEFEAHPEFVHEFDHHESDENLSLYPGFEYNNNAWGMTINLSACIGCNACTIACQAENNIPVVGKDQVAIGREMHWIRVDRYFEGDLDDPHTYHQPVTCMHCENAPCEVVCPVAATVHSEEGLNDMVYNRCVGTRYCSNNCPYKVRRFNFFQYNDNTIPVLRLLHNPDVTVRDRGVMEKCTYCVQRINAARIEAKKEGRPIRDGEIVTACQGACPTQAIVFGNINDADSEVARTKASPLNYSLLGELATEPRTTYLARISNPNPELETE